MSVWPVLSVALGESSKNCAVLHSSLISALVPSHGHNWRKLRQEREGGEEIKKKCRSKAERMQLKGWVTDHSARR